MHRNRWFHIFVSLTLLSCVAGCDLFSTRSTEPPLDSGTPWIPPTQRDQLFANMTIAFIELNSDHYLRSFFGPDDQAGLFLFVPNPNTANWPVFETWGYEQEKTTIEYLFTLISPDNPGFLMFNDAGDEVVYGDEDSVWVTKTYSLTVSLTEPNLNIPEAVEGTADFYLAKTDVGYWAIYRWEDLEGSPSWTELKAGLY
ncbi:hypothetical protein KKA00_05840 [bacterium]|nr:hypothetical protein [bacterium]